jgi:hypothetical protein
MIIVAVVNSDGQPSPLGVLRVGSDDAGFCDPGGGAAIPAAAIALLPAVAVLSFGLICAALESDEPADVLVIFPASVSMAVLDALSATGSPLHATTSPPAPNAATNNKIPLRSTMTLPPGTPLLMRKQFNAC